MVAPIKILWTINTAIKYTLSPNIPSIPIVIYTALWIRSTRIIGIPIDLNVNATTTNIANIVIIEIKLNSFSNVLLISYDIGESPII